jgi:hypothetical protein
MTDRGDGRTAAAGRARDRDLRSASACLRRWHAARPRVALWLNSARCGGQPMTAGAGPRACGGAPRRAPQAQRKRRRPPRRVPALPLPPWPVDGRAARVPAPIVPARIASHPPAGPSGPARRRRALEAVRGIVTSQDRQDHKIRPCRLCAVGDDVPSRPVCAVPVIGVSLVPPHPARLLVHVYLGVRVARPGADHRSGRALEWRVFVTAEWQGYFGAGPVGRCTRTPCLSPVRHVCLSGQAPRSAAHHLRRRMGGCGSWQSPI